MPGTAALFPQLHQLSSLKIRNSWETGPSCILTTYHKNHMFAKKKNQPAASVLSDLHWRHGNPSGYGCSAWPAPPLPELNRDKAARLEDGYLGLVMRPTRVCTKLVHRRGDSGLRAISRFPPPMSRKSHVAWSGLTTISHKWDRRGDLFCTLFFLDWREIQGQSRDPSPGRLQGWMMDTLSTSLDHQFWVIFIEMFFKEYILVFSGKGQWSEETAPSLCWLSKYNLTSRFSKCVQALTCCPHVAKQGSVISNVKSRLVFFSVDNIIICSHKQTNIESATTHEFIKIKSGLFLNSFVTIQSLVIYCWPSFCFLHHRELSFTLLLQLLFFFFFT